MYSWWRKIKHEKKKEIQHEKERWQVDNPSVTNMINLINYAANASNTNTVHWSVHRPRIDGRKQSEQKEDARYCWIKTHLPPLQVYC